MAWRRLLALLTSGLTMFSAYDALAGTKGSVLDYASNGGSIQASLGYSASSFESVFNSSLPQESVIVAGGDISVNAIGNAVVGLGDLSVVGSGGTTLCVDGRPSGAPRDILSGFLAPDEKESYGRPGLRCWWRMTWGM